MQIAMYYKEVYQNIGQTIAVPKALQNQQVEVHFLPIISIPKDKNLAKFSQVSHYGTGDKLVSYFSDVPLPEHTEDDFVLPTRQPVKAMDFL